jgi:hypothetical protein
MKANIFNLYNYKPTNIFSKFSNKQIIIYFILGLLTLYVATYSKNVSYIIIIICLICIYIYYSQTISNINSQLIDEKNKNQIKYLEITDFHLISRDYDLINILYEARFIKERSPDMYTKLIEYIEQFLMIFESLKRNINNIYLKPSNMIKPLSLTTIQKTILINDLRDQLEKILKHIQKIIHNIPHYTHYLDSYYKFSQYIRSHLSRYYNRILSDNNINDHTSQYQLIRSSENKYDFIY